MRRGAWLRGGGRGSAARWPSPAAATTTTAAAVRRAQRSGGDKKAGKVAVLLPDSKSSVRWETVDRPFLKQAFDAAGVESDDPERRGRQVHAAAAGRAGDHQRREGAAARQPRLRLRRGDRGQRQVPGRQGHRLRPPDAQRRLRLLRLVRQREGRPAPGRGPRELPRRQERPADRRAQRLADRQQRHAVQEGLRRRHQPEVRRRRLEEGRRPVRAGLGQPEGADDLRADAAEGQQQDRRRARGQRRPRQRGDLGAQAAQARRRSRSPARTRRCRASRTSSPATSA